MLQIAASSVVTLSLAIFPHPSYQPFLGECSQLRICAIRLRIVQKAWQMFIPARRFTHHFLPIFITTGDQWNDLFQFWMSWKASHLNFRLRFSDPIVPLRTPILQRQTTAYIVNGYRFQGVINHLERCIVIVATVQLQNGTGNIQMALDYKRFDHPQILIVVRFRAIDVGGHQQFGSPLFGTGKMKSNPFHQLRNDQIRRCRIYEKYFAQMPNTFNRIEHGNIVLVLSLAVGFGFIVQFSFALQFL